VSGSILTRRSDGETFKANPTFSFQVSFGKHVESKNDLPLDMNGQGVFAFKVDPQTELDFTTISIRVKSGDIEAEASRELVVARPEKTVINFYPDTGFYVPGTWNVIYF